MDSLEAVRFKEFLGRIFDDHQGDLLEELGAEEYARRRYDFVFHMTDWLDDLKMLNRLYESPEHFDLEKATIEIIGILYHVIPHLSAAGRLLLDEVPDPFAPKKPAEARPADDKVAVNPG